MLGIYIHIPYCKSKCGYCSFYSVTDVSSVPAYLNALEREISMVNGEWWMVNGKEDKDFLSDIKEGVALAKKQPPYTIHHSPSTIRHHAVDTVYIGGGTPSVLPYGSIRRILNKLRAHFDIVPELEIAAKVSNCRAGGLPSSKLPEITIEANPESCTQAFLSECVSCGVNRLSLGLQSHDDEILKNIGRPHRYADFENAVRYAGEAGITNVSVDLMTGLPGQTKASLAESLRRAVAFSSVRHLSLYALTVEENTPLYGSGFRPDEDLQAEMYHASVRFLEEAGFLRYEVSNFARPGCESRHNQKYWNGEEYLGFGAAAHSFVITDNEGLGGRWQGAGNNETKNEKRKTKNVGRDEQNSAGLNIPHGETKDVGLKITLLRGVRAARDKRSADGDGDEVTSKKEEVKSADVNQITNSKLQITNADGNCAVGREPGSAAVHPPHVASGDGAKPPPYGTETPSLPIHYSLFTIHSSTPHSSLLTPNSPSTLHPPPSAIPPTIERIENHADIARYIAGDVVLSRSAISLAERADEIVMLSLRTSAGLDTGRLKTETGRDILAEKEREIGELCRLNLLEFKNGRLFVQNDGYYLLNSILLKLQD